MTAAWILAAWLLAQHQHGGPPNKEPNPAVLMPGMGKYSRPIGAANAEAQRFFDQGLNLLYGYNRDAAYASFKRASELDPKNPLPKWGMAAAVGPYPNMEFDGYDMRKFCAILEGVQHPYAQAARTHCPDGNDDAYIAAMKSVMLAHPDDLDAAVLYADAIMTKTRWKWYDKAGNPAPGMEEAIATLENVLRRNPDHPGANHLYIHAVEMSPTPERAIPSAQRLMGIVPGAGHLVHMPGHIWLRTGDYEISASTNVRAVEVDREYFAKSGNVHSAYQGYYLHNIHFVAYSRAMQGRREDALKAAKELTEAVQAVIAAMPPLADVFLPFEWFMMERFREWDKLIAIEKPPAQLPISTALWHWARALARHHQGEDTVSEIAAYRAALRRVPESAMWMNSPAATVLSIATHLLEARVAKTDAARLEHWKAAVEAEDQLAYAEPPDWYYPVRESYGAALLQAGMAVEAEAAFREGLRRSPRNGRILFGLMESLRAQNKTEAAAMVERECREAWRRADITLTVGIL
jgi:tetratricopeptide (TPR) repeat protein